MSLSSTASRLSQVGRIHLLTVFFVDILLLTCCFKWDSSQICLPFRDKIHCFSRPSSIWNWCSLEENLWDLFRFCPQKPFLLSGNANQVSQGWQISIVWLYSGVTLNIFIGVMLNVDFYFKVRTVWSESEKCSGDCRESWQLWGWILNQSPLNCKYVVICKNVKN